jgi:hypothetical protein
VIRRLIGLALLLLLANAAYRVGIVWIHYQSFKDGVRETALFAGNKTDDQLKDHVMELAGENSILIDRDYVSVDRAGGAVTITASYVEMVSVVPGYPRRWQFDVVGR